MKGRIMAIERNTVTATAVSTGYKKSQQKNIVGDRKWYPGDGGNKVQNMGSSTSIDLTLCIYGENGEKNKVTKIDIRDTILEKNNLQKVSKQRLDQIIKDNEGQKVEFDVDGKNILFKPGQLKL